MSIYCVTETYAGLMCHIYGLLHTQYRAAHEKVQFTFCQYFMLEAFSRDAAPVIQSAGLHTSSTHIVERVQQYTGNRTVNRTQSVPSQGITVLA